MISCPVNCLQHRHPLLGTRIVISQQQQPQLVSQGVPALPLRVIERQNEEHWLREISAELLRPLKV
ncbi:MAG: hypothetical protein KME30_24905 [Iphinoe sp. HA4291-MV1]|nr:hypothetical protein [Iphinoe sp. HA4291-MV1]